MAHDFKAFPELTNNQMQFYYLQSPHKQITESFNARVIKVIDGDTILVDWRERDFTFPVRFSNLAAPELSEDGGREAQIWLEQRILGEEIDILIDPDNRVEKWGRILGQPIHNGLDIAQEEIFRGLAKPWGMRKEGLIIDPVRRPKDAS
tara:strand:- start:569 stop:1015 length:447 start_codon:yes stop_codon:yes gene_type:complete